MPGGQGGEDGGPSGQPGPHHPMEMTSQGNLSVLLALEFVPPSAQLCRCSIELSLDNCIAGGCLPFGTHSLMSTLQQLHGSGGSVCHIQAGWLCFWKGCHCFSSCSQVAVWAQVCTSILGLSA